jgi:hypothetical protein
MRDITVVPYLNENNMKEYAIEEGH